MSIKMRTAYGAQPLTPEALEGELIAARDIEDAFVILERDQDGAFVQFNGEQLEFGRDGDLHRFDSAAAARAAFERFLAGDDLAGGEGWRDVSEELAEAAAARKRSWIFGLVIALVVGAISAWFWWKLNGAS